MVGILLSILLHRWTLVLLLALFTEVPRKKGSSRTSAVKCAPNFGFRGFSVVRQVDLYPPALRRALVAGGHDAERVYQATKRRELGPPSQAGGTRTTLLVRHRAPHPTPHDPHDRSTSARYRPSPAALVSAHPGRPAPSRPEGLRAISRSSPPYP